MGGAEASQPRGREGDGEERMGGCGEGGDGDGEGCQTWIAALDSYRS